MKMKKIVSLLMAFAMVFSLASCGGNSEPAEETEKPAAETPAEPAEVDTSKYEVTEPVTIQFWHNYTIGTGILLLPGECVRQGLDGGK